MYEMKHLYYRKGKDGITDVYVFYAIHEGWEVYYKRPGFPMMFAFGLPFVHAVSDVFVIADSNINQYEEMFK